MKTMSRWLSVMALSAGLMLSPVTYAGLFDDKEARKEIADLRANYNATQQIVQAQNKRISELSDALARANGQVDELVQEVTKLRAEQESGYESVDQRLQALENPPPKTKAQK